ncbi:MAG: carboxypeptidase M32 [Chloroflexi bacterium]|nr:carboxypeptidase M32 [Chloroflexota bacterium]
MSEHLEEFKAIIADVDDLYKAQSVLNWDQQAYMPPGGAQARASQVATLSRLAHERFTSERVGALLDLLSAETRDLPYEDDTVSMLRVLQREYVKAVRLPAAFVAELAEASGLATTAWAQARAANDWHGFESHLAHMLELKQREAEYLGYSDRMYDALLDEYEPGMKTAQVTEIFDAVRRELVPLVQTIRAHSDRVEDAAVLRHYDPDKQWALAHEALRAIGYDFERGRMDRVPHPFCTTFSNHDVRVTNRILPDFFNSCLFGALHEGGHALYEQGSPDKFERTALAGGASLGVHESQSRLWENLVGRSRAFWEFFFPKFKRTFRKNAADLDAEKMYRAVNKVQPSLIRVEADEVTYSLHVMLRFEAENLLLENKLRVAELPAWWDEAMSSYLGITPPDVAQGVLQDVHWSMGLYGYFPTYSLGTFFSAQLFEQARKELGNLDAQFAQGEFEPLRQWLQQKIYQHGRKFTLNELANQITGEPLQTRSYIAYLKNKYAEIYGL